MSRPTSLREYREICQKGSDENYLFDKYVVRRLSIFVTIPCIRLGVSANQVTAISLVALLASLACYLSSEPWLLLTGSGLLFVYYLLDHVDGELARYHASVQPERHRGLGGQYFDVLCHSYSSNAIMLSWGIALSIQFDSAGPLVVAMVAHLGMNDFPRHIATRVTAAAVARSPERAAEDEVQRALGVLEYRQHQVAAVNERGWNLRKLRKAATEAVGFPGILVVIMGVAVVDALVTEVQLLGHEVPLRLLLLGGLAVLHSIRGVVRGIAFYRLVDRVPVASPR